MKIFTRLAPTLTIAVLALAACDPAEFDSDPEVRSEARGARLCTTAVKSETGDAGAVLNTTLPIIELNQIIIDTPASQSRWMCLTDDGGTPQSIYQMGRG
ncbi:MAG: hypothetical protein ACSHWZ_08500 [Sulfitobacter sp.]